MSEKTDKEIRYDCLQLAHVQLTQKCIQAVEALKGYEDAPLLEVIQEYYPSTEKVIEEANKFAEFVLNPT